jgi:1-phosphofructokinase
MSIVTVTPNPSVDRTVHVGELRRGAVLRASGSSVHASGKGVNVTRALRAHAVQSSAVLPLGGHEGGQLRALAKAEGIAMHAIAIAGRSRSNVSIVEPDGIVTKLNEQGPQLTRAECDELLRVVAEQARDAAWVVGCGSLPLGAPDDLYAEVAALARSAGARVAIDSSGSPLTRAIAVGVDLIKPNTHELAEATGRRPATVGEAVDAAQELRARGAGTVLVSLGADGALLVDRDGARHGEAPVDSPASTVGAGDALLAGFLAAGAAGSAALAEGLAWGAAAVRLTDSGVPGPQALDRAAVVMHAQVDRERPLADAKELA